MKPLKISHQIRAFRRDRGLSQSEFGALFGVSAQAVSKWEREISCPDLTLLSDLAEAMELTIPELLYGPKPKE